MSVLCAGAQAQAEDESPGAATPAPELAPAHPDDPSPAKAPQPSYEDLVRRIEALEKTVAEQARPKEAQSTAAAFIQNRFNPDLSLVADVALVGVNVDDATANRLAVPGLFEESERVGKLRGFNFNYLELGFSTAVDPYFDFFGVVTIGAEGVEVEEVYVDSRQLPFGFKLRLGKLLSSCGRLNGMHKHYWDFYDAPLVFEALIGGEGMKNPGLRLSWTAPVDFLLEVNLEVFQGVFDESRTFNAAGYELEAADGSTLSGKTPLVPGLYAASVKTSFDTGDHVFLLGASVMYGHSTQAGEDAAFYAPGTVLYGAELTYKYLISSYRSLTWQTEYLGRWSAGDLALASDGLVHRQEKQQGGLYSQLVWRFDDPGRWRVGARFDLITQNSVKIDGVEQPLENLLTRYTAMLEYSPTEFARFRVQYAYDRSRYLDGARRDVHEVLLNVNVAVGPHGAHSF